MVMDRCAIFRSACLPDWLGDSPLLLLNYERTSAPRSSEASTKTVKVINKNMKDTEQETHFSNCRMWRIAS